MKEGRFAQLCKNMKDANKSIKVNDNSLRNAGMADGKAVTDQLDGGEKLQQSAMIMHEVSKPVTEAASRGAELLKRQAIKLKHNKIKKVNSGKKLARKEAKDAAKKVAKKSSKAAAKVAAKETPKVVAETITTAVASTAGTTISPGVGTAIGLVDGEIIGEKVAFQMASADTTSNIRSRKFKFVGC